jgi:hypothetical protein
MFQEAQRSELRQLNGYVLETFGVQHFHSVLEVAQNTQWIFPEVMIRDFGDLVMDFIPPVYAEAASILNKEELNRTMAMLELLRFNKQIIAPFVHIRAKFSCKIFEEG